MRTALTEVFYFCYYLAVGVYMTFLPTYFRGQGLTGRELSTVFAVTPLFALVIPLGWAYLAELAPLAVLLVFRRRVDRTATSGRF